MQTGCNKVVVKLISGRMCSHCLFQVVATSIKQVVIGLVGTTCCKSVALTNLVRT